jgi:hypothetical protein
MFHCFPLHVNACSRERRLHVVANITFILSVNHVTPVRQSQSIHAPHLGRGFINCTFLRASDTKPRRCCRGGGGGGGSIALPTRSVSDSMSLFSPKSRGVAADFSSPSHCRCNLSFFKTHAAHYKYIFVVVMIF